MICGGCGGRSKVNSFGVVVACPHCGDHLFIPADAAVNGNGPLVISPEPKTNPDPETKDSLDEATLLPGGMPTPQQNVHNSDADTRAEFVLEVPPPIVTEFPELDFSKPAESQQLLADAHAGQQLPEQKPAESQPVAEASVSENRESAASAAPTTEPAADPAAACTSETTKTPVAEIASQVQNACAEGDADAIQVNPIVAEAATSIDQLINVEESPQEHGEFDFNFTSPAAPAKPAEQPALTEQPSLAETTSLKDKTKPADQKANPVSKDDAQPETKTVSWTLFVIVLSYASAITLVLLYQLMSNRTHQLESLPDVKLPGKAFRIVPEDASLPGGHQLKIGDSRRFGNMLVTVEKVTREPLVLEHFSGDASKNDRRGNVIKLWLKFKNVSRNQVFSPLDEQLMLGRATDPKTNRIRANNFICQVNQKKKSGQLVYVFDLPEASGYQFAGLGDFAPLEPGEEVEMYIPTTEDNLEYLKGDLVWRVHFRKGLHEREKAGEKTLLGITTLLEVRFRSNQIKSS